LLRANVWVFMLILSHPLALCSDFVGRAPLPDAGASPMLPRPDVDRFFDVASGGPPFSLSMTVTRILPGATREGVWDFTIQVGVNPLRAGCHPSAGHMLCVRPIPTLPPPLPLYAGKRHLGVRWWTGTRCALRGLRPARAHVRACNPHMSASSHLLFFFVWCGFTRSTTSHTVP
jgi:hypothetical protein